MIVSRRKIAGDARKIGTIFYDTVGFLRTDMVIAYGVAETK